MKLKNHSERISANHYLFSCDYSWGGTDFPAGIKEWKKIMKQLLLIFC